MSSEIVVAAVGEVEAQVLSHLCTAVAETLGRECRVGDSLPAPDHAFNSRRMQYSADAILKQLRAGEAERVMGVVDLDLYVPDLNFVFGLADPHGRRAVIALPRLRQQFYGMPGDEMVFLARAVKEAVHELGHTYGLSHCNDRRCVMAFSNSLADTDYKEHEFCPRCRRRFRDA